MKNTSKRLGTTLLALAAAITVVGCTGATATSDMIAFTVGTGQNGQDASVHKITYPGQKATFEDKTYVLYLPANTRNYVVGNSSDADRQTPAPGRTSTGTPVNVFVGASWTLNQDRNVLLNETWPFMLKYGAAVDSPTSRTEISAPSEGWTRMLTENFGRSIDASVRKVLPQFGDEIWKDQAKWDEVAKAISDDFQGQLRSRVGYTDDLFCGAGSLSTWTGEPGADGSSFTCAPITFEVIGVTAANSSQQDAQANANAASQTKQANKEALDAAEAKYGDRDRAGSVLGQVDIINACKDAGVTCVVNVDGAPVTVPASKAEQTK